MVDLVHRLLALPEADVVLLNTFHGYVLDRLVEDSPAVGSAAYEDQPTTVGHEEVLVVVIDIAQFQAWALRSYHPRRSPRCLCDRGFLILLHLAGVVLKRGAGVLAAVALVRVILLAKEIV